MGFIPNSNKTLTAYYTQKGREYIVSGDKDGFSIKHFALCDGDVNYLIASQPGPNSEYNMLEAGSIPDLSGDQTGAIHSLAGGMKQRSFIFGGSAIKYMGSDKQLGTARSGVRFQQRQAAVSISKFTTGFERVTFGFNVELFGVAVTGNEKVKIYPLPPSQGTSPEIYTSLSADDGVNGGIYSWAPGDNFAKTISGSISSSLPEGTYEFTAKFKVVPYKSAISLDLHNSVIRLDITFRVSANQGVSGSSGIGFNFSVRQDVGFDF